MRFLILGAGGMTGHLLAVYFQERGHQVKGFARRRLPWCPTFIGDALSRDAVQLALKEDQYDAVINCVGVLNQAVDAAPAAAIDLNACLPHYLAEWTRRCRTKIIHISTDCVFSGIGNSGGYLEEADYSAHTLYGRSKALGELKDEKNLTFRTSLVGPDVNARGIGLLNWFMQQQGKVGGYDFFHWTGVTTLVLGRAIEAAMRENLSGLYHLVNPTSVTKCALLQLFNQMRRDPIEIMPVQGETINKSLLNTRGDFSFSVPAYDAMVSEMHAWIAAHAALYPQYEVKPLPK